MSRNTITQLTDGRPPLPLPDLPKVVRYWDDFDGAFGTISNIGDSDALELKVDGKNIVVNFSQYGSLADIMRHVVVDWVGRLDPHSVIMHLGRLRSYLGTQGDESIYELVVSSRSGARRQWEVSILPSVTSN